MRAPATAGDWLRWLFTAIAAVALLALAGLCAHRADAQTVTTTREGAADWLCCDDAGCTSATQHQRQDKAIEACTNRAFADGKTRWIVPARYRVEVTTSTPTTPIPLEGGAIGRLAATGTAFVPARLSWTAPTKNTNGTPISGNLTYRVDAQSGSTWNTLATVTALTYVAPTETGCWRVSAIVGGVASDPAGPVCKN